MTTSNSIDFTQKQQQEFYPLEDDYGLMEQEQAYFEEYDRAVAAQALQADYDDAYNFEDQLQEEEEMDDAMDYIQEQQGNDDESTPTSSYEYEQDSLLHLIVGVQSYLTDMASAGIDRKDSPLLELQYKMYTYLKQRACEMGVDTEAMSL